MEGLVILVGLGLAFPGFFLLAMLLDSREKKKYAEKQAIERNACIAERDQMLLSWVEEVFGEEKAAALRSVSVDARQEELNKVLKAKVIEKIESYCQQLGIDRKKLVYLPVADQQKFFGLCGIGNGNFYYDIDFAIPLCWIIFLGRKQLATDSDTEQFMTVSDVDYIHIKLLDSGIDAGELRQAYDCTIGESDRLTTKYNEDIKSDIIIKKILIEFLKKDQLSYQSFPISDIKYFKWAGSKTYTTETTVSGGGANVGGAVVGAVLAGVSGVVVGSRVGTEIETQNTTVAHDERQITFVYSKDGSVNIAIFNGRCGESAYKAFNIIIPQKNYDLLVVEAAADKE